MAQYLGQAVLTRSNPLVCHLVVYRGKAQGRKHYTYSGLLIGARTRPVLLVDWSDLDARKRHYLLRASLAVNGRSATVYEEVHTLASKDKRRTHRAFLRQLQAVLPVGCRPIIVTDAGFRTPWFQQVVGLGLGRADPQPAQVAVVDAGLTPTRYQQAQHGPIPGSGSPDTFQPPGCHLHYTFRPWLRVAARWPGRSCVCIGCA